MTESEEFLLFQQWFLSFERALSHISVEENAECDVIRLYELFKFSQFEAGKESGITRRLFSEIIKNLFPTTTTFKKRIGGCLRTLYRGISYRENGVYPNSSIHFTDIKNHAPSAMELKISPAHKLLFQEDTGCVCNGNSVFKNLHFLKNKTFQITICEKTLDLEHLCIDPSFELTENNVKAIFKIFQSLTLCRGLKYMKCLKVGKSKTMETWRCDGEEFRSLRSAMCYRAVSIISKTFTCRICQKQSIQENKENVANVSETTEQTLKRLFPQAPDKMLILLKEQSKNCGIHKKGRRWSKEFITTCLHLYIRSPKGYEMLKNSEIFILPSTSTLILYKNSVKQEPGFDEQIFQWMNDEAQKQGINDEMKLGGIIFDEMSIQTDLQFEKNGSVLEIVGFTELGSEGDICQTLKKATPNKIMGTHVLQLLFLGLNGFRFPFAHFITDNIQASQLYGLFWKACYLLYSYGFKVVFTCMDGAQCNRSFMNICLGPTPTQYEVQSPFNQFSIQFIMDISHVIKKIRNNILKSGINKSCTRLLTLNDCHEIHWQMFIDYFHWDQQNAFQLHRKLTREHIYPDSQSKMRNYLATDMLNSTMLQCLTTYKQSLGDKGEVLNGLIEFLQQTSTLVRIFEDRKPICELSDSRLTELKVVDKWMTNWEQSTSHRNKKSALMSSQCHEDIHSCITGFIALCETVIKMKSPVFVTPALINSDVIENIFNQQRSTYNGANTNPTALQYGKTINTIILNEHSISKKANAARSSPGNPYTSTLRPPKQRKRSESVANVDSTIKVLKM